jgi:hypothetical protein
MVTSCFGIACDPERCGFYTRWHFADYFWQKRREKRSGHISDEAKICDSRTYKPKTSVGHAAAITCVKSIGTKWQ